MGIFSFGKKDSTSVRRSAGAGFRSGPDSFGDPDAPRVVRRRRAQASRARMDTADAAEAMLLDPTLPEKQRARRRLVGAVALVAAAVVILPMVLDSHPNPVTGDINIDIPNSPDSGADPTQADSALDDAYAAPGVQMDVSAVAGHPAPLPGASELSAVGGGAALAGAHAGNPGALARNAATGAGANAGISAGTNVRTAATSSQPAAQTARHPTQSAQTAQSVRSDAASAATSAAGTARAATAAASQPAQARSPTALAAGQRASAAGTATAGAAGTTAGATASSSGATLSSTAPATGNASARPSPGARFAVQLGSLPSDAAANNWVAKLKAVGVPAYVERRQQPDGKVRVLLRAGPFIDRDAAVAAIARVRGAGLLTSRNGEETE